MKSVLVTGSLAYDYLYSFPGKFQDSIISGSDKLSVAFNVNEKQVHLGGCAGNIVYSGSLINAPFKLIGIAGKDFDQYREWLIKNNIDASYVICREDMYTSQAAVVTDSHNQQITFFYPGAADKALHHENELNKTIDNLSRNSSLAIMSPNGRDFMIIMLKGFIRNSLPYVFDPGQTIPLFTASELKDYASKAAGLIANEYEVGQLMKCLGMKIEELVDLAKFTIITKGKDGALLYFKGQKHIIPVPKKVSDIDPTGCGDAFRAGLLATIRTGINLESLLEGCRKGTELAVQCLSVVGTQNHKINE